jgi:UDP-N-acetylglucosamine--N-acetylmuramyl-(pentapeptide) pyrophosphoryl-undecaprenol N-acetylglucosamine transferase
MAGGGTGGHVIPALAVARELRKRGHYVFFVGTDRGLESKLAPAEGFELKRIKIGGLNRVSAARKAATLARLPFTTLGCLSESAAAVFSMGGYVAGPPVIAALLRRTPVVVMEPNAVAGFTNRKIGRLVFRALISFPETAAYFKKGRSELTGLPVRDEFFQLKRKPRGATLNLLVTGGSQGSHALNLAGQGSWPALRAAGVPVRVVHQTGRADFEKMHEAFAASGLEGEIAPFIEDMPAAFANADLVICRAGAGAVSELAAAGKPSILVPFPFAADDHQTRNAQAMERSGAAKLISETELTGDSLAAAIVALAATGLEPMAEKARALGKPGAAVRAADILEEAAGV